MTRAAEQRAQALQHANRIRRRRADHRAALHHAPVELACIATVALLRGVPDWAATWSIGRVLLCVPRVGPQLLPRLLARCGVAEHRRVCDLTVRQREAVEGELRKMISPLEIAS